jgi:hypothetical protein
LDKNHGPEFVVAPNAFDSKENSVIAANVRRVVPDDTPIAVMIHGKERRERVDMCQWLIENGYMPMFPRYIAAQGSMPLARLQLIHEVRPILDREPNWEFVCYGWGEGESPTTVSFPPRVYDYMQSTGNFWEILR